MELHPAAVLVVYMYYQMAGWGKMQTQRIIHVADDVYTRNTAMQGAMPCTVLHRICMAFAQQA